jgi:adenylyltransferase/sulfurtransferase
VPVPRISRDDLKSRLDNAEPVAKPLLLDVRLKYPYEHSTMKLPGSTRMAPDAVNPAQLPRDREIVAHCKMGGRSAKATEFLKSVGFTNVKNLKGGILDWIDKVDPSQPKY